MSFIEQQAPVAHTKDLSVAVDFLPGEDDVKIREGSVNRTSCWPHLFTVWFWQIMLPIAVQTAKRCITENSLSPSIVCCFSQKNHQNPLRYEQMCRRIIDVSFPFKILVDVPLGMISQIGKVGGQTRSNIRDRGAYGIEIHCKVQTYSRSIVALYFLI